MKSCLYECEVLHARFEPRAHRFSYRIFLFALDLEEIPELARKLTLFSAGRSNLYSFRDRDYLPLGERQHLPASPEAPSPQEADLRQRVETYAAANGVDISGGRVLLVTLPRVFGYLFNPVSFYFCLDRSGAPAAAIAEVTNTFREMKPFFLRPDPADAARGVFHLRVPKHFYVSPFSDVDVAFDFHLRLPADRLAVHIDDYAGERRTLTSTLTGDRRALTSGRLAWFTFKYPALTLRVISLIHWHALRLWLKRVPWFAKAARAGDQRGLYRPHHSLSPGPAPISPAVPSESA
ncbi:MAG: hypothetical protein RIR76_1086 [Verrucomicrobiota bacterium]|jgi:DUF1365 family protein